jgi:O-antigen ligase
MPDLPDTLAGSSRQNIRLRSEATPRAPSLVENWAAQAVRLPSQPLVAKGPLPSRLAFGLFSLFVFSIPWENAVVFPGGVTVSHMLGLVALPVFVLAVLESKRLRGFSLPVLMMGLFMAWGSLSYFWTVDAEATALRIVSWTQNLVMVWLILELAACRAKQLVLMRAYVLGTLVSSCDTILSYITGSEAFYNRYAGSGFDPNDLGLLLAMSIPLSLYLSTIEKRRGLVWVYRLQLVIVMLAIGLTSSRAALIATLVAWLYAPLVFVRMKFGKICAFFLVGVLAICSALVFLPETSWDRWGGTGMELEHGTWGARRVIWSAGFELFRNHPVLGVGAGGFGIGTSRILGQEQVAHNTFLSVLVEEGLIGLGLFLVLLLSLVLPALRLRPVERSLWLILFATWAVGVSTLTWEARKPTWLLFGLLAGWLATSLDVGRYNGRMPTVAWRAI